jgi:hypothetical protein
MKIMSSLLLFILFGGLLESEQIFKEIILDRIFVVDNQGYIYTDKGENSICKYSPQGELLLTIGRPGEGAGDIKRLGWFAIHPKEDVIYVTESFRGNRWISKFAKDGKYLGEWNCNVEKSKWPPMNRIKFDAKDNVIIEVTKINEKQVKDFLILRSAQVFLKFTPTGTLSGEFYKTEYDHSISDNNIVVTIPYINEVKIEIFNDRLVLKHDNDEFVGIYDMEGKLEKRITLPFKKEPVTTQDKEAWEKDITGSPWGKHRIAEGVFKIKWWQDRMPYPKYKPLTDIMLIDSEGFLFLRKYNRYEKGENLWAKIDLSNEKITVVKSKPGDTPMALWKNYVFFTRTNEDEDTVMLKAEKSRFFY